MRRTPAVGAMCCLVVASACSSSAKPPPAATPASPTVRISSAPPAVRTLSTPLPCSATSGLALPAGWPALVPLPKGMVVIRTERRSGDRLIATSRVPGDFHELVRFFDKALPPAGFTLRDAEVDPFDAEADFVGATVQGRWSVGLSHECAGMSNLTMLVLPRQPAPPP